MGESKLSIVPCTIAIAGDGKAISLLRKVFCYPGESLLLDSNTGKEVGVFCGEIFWENKSWHLRAS